MTKENKIALVVGFALILIVGILISDQLSTARTQESADLLPSARDPLLERGDDPRLLLFPPAQTSPPPVTSPLDSGGAVTVQGPRTAPPPVMDSSPVPGPASAAVAFHTIRGGESLTVICQQHYGDGTLAKDLARYNNLPNPDVVMAGLRLRMPPVDQLRPGTSPNARPIVAIASPPPQTVDARTTYTVRSGDVLSTVAQRILGSARRWRELYEHNRDQIDDPDHLVTGTVLRIPQR